MKKSQLAFSFLLLPYLLSSLACSKQNFGLQKQSATFQQTPEFNNKVDVLFMIDDSPGMSPYHSKLSEQMSTMLNTLNATGMDYQVAVTTSSIGLGFIGGKLIGSPAFLTKSSPFLTDNLISRLKLTGNLGSDLEQGMASVKSSLSNLTGESAQFIRDDAFLAVIILSTEDDYSTPSGGVDTFASYYAAYFDSIKRPFPNGARSWVLNYLGILDMSSTCVTNVGPVTYIEPGLRYMALVDKSDGIKESICDGNWANMVKNVRVRINQLMTDFFLNRKPKVETIVVFNNGRMVPKDSTNGWSYQEKVEGTTTKYQIRFHGTAVPSLYDKIEIKFDPVSPT